MNCINIRADSGTIVDKYLEISKTLTTTDLNIFNEYISSIKKQYKLTPYIYNADVIENINDGCSSNENEERYDGTYSYNGKQYKLSFYFKFDKETNNSDSEETNLYIIKERMFFSCLKKPDFDELVISLNLNIPVIYSNRL